MRWSNATRSLADLAVNSDPEEGLCVAVFGADDADRAEFCEAARIEVDQLLPEQTVRVDIDLRKRPQEGAWSSAFCGILDGIGLALKQRGAAPGPNTAGHRAFSDLDIVERAVGAARKAAESARARIPDLKAVVEECKVELESAQQRRSAANHPGTPVTTELARNDADMSELIFRCGTLAGVLKLKPASAHEMSELARLVRGPHRQLWRAIRFAVGGGGAWVLLFIVVLTYGGVAAWELLPVTEWLGPKVIGVDMRPVAAVISWLTAIAVLYPGYQRAFLLRRLATQGWQRWEVVLAEGCTALDLEVEHKLQALAKAKKQLDSTQRIGSSEKQKVDQLRSGIGLGGFVGRLLAAQGANMERWARTFDRTRSDIETAIRRLGKDSDSPVRRFLMFIEGLDTRLAEGNECLGVLRYLATLKGLIVLAPVDAGALRDACANQEEKPRVEKALMFMEDDAKEFAAALPPQVALDRSFNMGVFALPRGADGSGPSHPPAGRLPAGLASGCSELSNRLSALAPTEHNRRRLVEVLRWVRSLSDLAGRAGINAPQGSNGEVDDTQAVMLLASVLLGDPDHAQAFLAALQTTKQEQFSKFIEHDLRPTGKKKSADQKLSKAGNDAWMGLCRRLLQVREHTPGAQSIEVLRRWSPLVAEAVAGSMPLVHPLPVEMDA